jgi:hypothetical protein
MGLPYVASSLALIFAAQAVTTASFNLPVRHGASRVVTICLAHDGSVLQGRATCSYERRTGAVSDCRCPSGAMAAQTKICWPGEHPAADSAAANRARWDAAASHNGDLMSARFEGRSFCQHVRDDGYPHWTFPVEGTPALRRGN